MTENSAIAKRLTTRPKGKRSHKKPAPKSGPSPPALPVEAAEAKREVLPAKERAPPHPITEAITAFMVSIDDFRNAAVVALPLVAKEQIKSLKKSRKKLARLVLEGVEIGEGFLKTADIHKAADIVNALHESRNLEKSKPVEALARSLFIGLFSAYDTFTGSLLHAIYKKKPELFKGIKREIALTDLLAFNDLLSVMADMLEKEIDTFRRASYVEQFAELERKFDINTLKAFPEWPAFVEIGQRRNVMTHNNGCVSQQYLNICEKEGHNFSVRPKVKEQLRVDFQYLLKAMFLLEKVGFMLAHTLWHKVLPDDHEAAHKAMNETIYSRLTNRRWKSAAEYGAFGMQPQLTRKLDDLTRRIRLINVAIALKHLKEREKMDRLLEAEDWTAAIREFKLACAVLTEGYSEAKNLMLAIGKSGEILDQLDYHTWPLFIEFRQRPEFLEAYEKIYGVPFLKKVSEEAQEQSTQLEHQITEAVKQ